MQQIKMIILFFHWFFKLRKPLENTIIVTTKFGSQPSANIFNLLLIIISLIYKAIMQVQITIKLYKSTSSTSW